MRNWMMTKLPKKVTSKFLAELEQAVGRNEPGAVKFAEAHRAALAGPVAKQLLKVDLTALSTSQLGTIGLRIAHGLEQQLKSNPEPSPMRDLQKVLVRYLTEAGFRLGGS